MLKGEKIVRTYSSRWSRDYWRLITDFCDFLRFLYDFHV